MEVKVENLQVDGEAFEFLIMAESGILEAQATLLCESIRRFSGRYANAYITVISPRPDRRPSNKTLRRLDALNVNYIPMNIVSPCPEYGTSFRVLASAEYERMSKSDTLICLDSDSVFLGEPDLNLKGSDAACRPVDVKGMCTTGKTDPKNDYWIKLCSVCDTDYNMIPYVKTTVDKLLVKASYNGGFVVVRRNLGIFQRTARYFQQSVNAGLRPFAGRNHRIRAGYGLVSYEGSEYWGSSQACLSIAIWCSGLSVRMLPPTHNFPLQFYDKFLPEIEKGALSNIIHVHYHHLSFTSSSNPIMGGYPGFPPEGVFWLQERFKKNKQINLHNIIINKLKISVTRFKNIKKYLNFQSLYKIKSGDAPIFIFAASWRTGSTLLQRIIIASGEVFIWGEPTFLSQARTLYERMRSYFEKVKKQRNHAFKMKIGKWIPVVSPAPERAKDALMSFFQVLYKKETTVLGRKRWGFKEVRSDAVRNIYFLKEIYPNARFVFLVRDPYDMYRSLKAKDFFANFKDPFEAVHVWNDNVCQFFADEKIREFCLLVRYEDLVTQSREAHVELSKIAAHVQITIRERMFKELEAKTDPSGYKSELTADEIQEISHIVVETVPLLGYKIH